MLKLDQLLGLIGDGAWHNLKELSKQSGIPRQKLTAASRLLSKTNIIEYQAKDDQVRLTREWQQLFDNSSSEEKGEKAAICTIVLPPRKVMKLQGIQVTNLTGMELELSMRVNKELEELAIGTMCLPKST